ncbi:MAG TPA: hypothetical protein VLW46_00465 [Candidatus Bathyarchaeia archaeon]|nr:hypothetical protein [Candidatus Bathyarchaeia archaeon]
MNITRIDLWLKGLIAAAVSGGAGGILTGFAAVGIDPQFRRQCRRACFAMPQTAPY